MWLATCYLVLLKFNSNKPFSSKIKKNAFFLALKTFKKLKKFGATISFVQSRPSAV